MQKNGWSIQLSRRLEFTSELRVGFQHDEEAAGPLLPPIKRAGGHDTTPLRHYATRPHLTRTHARAHPPTHPREARARARAADRGGETSPRRQQPARAVLTMEGSSPCPWWAQGPGTCSAGMSAGALESFVRGGKRAPATRRRRGLGGGEGTRRGATRPAEQATAAAEGRRAGGDGGGARFDPARDGLLYCFETISPH